MAQISEMPTILIQSFGELFDQTKFDVQRWEKYPVSVYQSVVNEVLCSAIPPLHASPSSCNAELCSYHPTCTKKTRVLGEPRLFSQQTVLHL